MNDKEVFGANGAPNTALRWNGCSDAVGNGRFYSLSAYLYLGGTLQAALCRRHSAMCRVPPAECQHQQLGKSIHTFTKTLLATIISWSQPPLLLLISRHQLANPDSSGAVCSDRFHTSSAYLHLSGTLQRAECQHQCLGESIHTFTKTLLAASISQFQPPLLLPITRHQLAKPDRTTGGQTGRNLLYTFIQILTHRNWNSRQAPQYKAYFILKCFILLNFCFVLGS